MRSILKNRLGRAAIALTVAGLGIVAATASADARDWRYRYYNYWDRPAYVVGPTWGYPNYYYAPPRYYYSAPPYYYHAPPAYYYRSPGVTFSVPFG